jgi:hypothetical protein
MARRSMAPLQTVCQAPDFLRASVFRGRMAPVSRHHGAPRGGWRTITVPSRLFWWARRVE